MNKGIKKESRNMLFVIPVETPVAAPKTPDLLTNTIEVSEEETETFEAKDVLTKFVAPKVNPEEGPTVASKVITLL